MSTPLNVWVDDKLDFDQPVDIEFVHLCIEEYKSKIGSGSSSPDLSGIGRTETITFQTDELNSWIQKEGIFTHSNKIVIEMGIYTEAALRLIGMDPTHPDYHKYINKITVFVSPYTNSGRLMNGSNYVQPFNLGSLHP